MEPLLNHPQRHRPRIQSGTSSGTRALRSVGRTQIEGLGDAPGACRVASSFEPKPHGLTFALWHAASSRSAHPQVRDRSHVMSQVHAALELLGSVDALEEVLRTSESSDEAARFAPSSSGSRSPANSPFFNLSGGIQ